MKGAFNLLFLLGAVIAVGIVAYFGTGLIGIANLSAVLNLPSNSKILLEPQYGFYECELKGTVNENNIPFQDKGFWEQTVECPAGARECTLGVRMCCDGFACGALTALQVDMTRINVYGLWGAKEYFNWHASSGTCYDIVYQNTFVPGEKLHIASAKNPFANITAYGIRRYDAYHLIQEPSIGGKYEINSVSCNLPLVRTKQIGDQIIPEICIGGCEQWGKVNKAGSDNTLSPGEIWNYLGGYNLAPDAMLIQDPIDGTGVYCQQSGSAAMLKVLREFNTDSGITYYVPSETKRDVECCPGMTYLGKSCDASTLKWVSTVQYKCDQFNTISACPGSGGWVVDPSDVSRQSIMRATGCDSGGGCIMATQKVECTTNAQCSSNRPQCINYVCTFVNPDPWVSTCGNNVCETGENQKASSTYCPADCESLPTCGDLICQVGETPANCPGDCSTSIWNRMLNFFMVWAVGTVIALIVLFVASFLLPLPMLKGFAVKNWKLLIVAAMALGLMIALIFAVPVANIAASVFGGSI